jgi:hypothetical protein
VLWCSLAKFFGVGIVLVGIVLVGIVVCLDVARRCKSNRKDGGFKCNPRWSSEAR